ncbi:MAG: helix-turn-helix domain-containing protein [Trichlorobacter sp.]|jgi:excisionase family DNA binding protein|nr:helix-turn-helix domain-containing protein [Trichlorobacter sp.]
MEGAGEQKQRLLVGMQEIAKELNIGRSVVAALVKDEGMPHHRFGKRNKFSVEEVREWLQERRERLAA